MIKKKIIINLTEDWFFISHFLSRAIDAEKAGYDIYVSCNQTNNRKFIENNKIKFIPLSIDRKSINPFYEFYTL